MTLILDQTLRNENEIREFAVISQNASGVSCRGGIVIIPKSNYEHLSEDEYEHILMSFVEVKENKAEIPKTLLVKAKKTTTDVKISSEVENYIFDDPDWVYLDLLRCSPQA